MSSASSYGPNLWAVLKQLDRKQLEAYAIASTLQAVELKRLLPGAKQLELPSGAYGLYDDQLSECMDAAELALWLYNQRVTEAN